MIRNFSMKKYIILLMFFSVNAYGFMTAKEAAKEASNYKKALQQEKKELLWDSIKTEIMRAVGSGECEVNITFSKEEMKLVKSYFKELKKKGYVISEVQYEITNISWCEE